jgi:hypothetical protein
MATVFVGNFSNQVCAIPGSAGYAHYNDVNLYPALPGTRTERVKGVHGSELRSRNLKKISGRMR